MFWSKILVSVMLIVVSFNGCAYLSAVSIQGTWNPKNQMLGVKEPLFLETVNNEEFKKFLLEKKVNIRFDNEFGNSLNSLNENNILWVDNMGNIPTGYNDYTATSSKIIVTKEDVYIVSVPDVWIWSNKKLNNKNYKDFEYDVTRFDHFYQRSLQLNIESSKALNICNTIHPDLKCLTIKSRYNDIEKIKSIIDERVEYFKKLQADSAQK